MYLEEMGEMVEEEEARIRLHSFWKTTPPIPTPKASPSEMRKETRAVAWLCQSGSGISKRELRIQNSENVEKLTMGTSISFWEACTAHILPGNNLQNQSWEHLIRE